MVRGSSGADVFFGGDAVFFGVIGCAAANVLSPEDCEGGGNRGYSPTVVPCAQRGDLIGELRFQGIGGWGIVPCLDESGEWLLEPGKIAVVGCGDQGVEGEILLIPQDPDGVKTARGFCAGLDIYGVVLLAQTAFTSAGPWPVVAVVEPAAFRVQQLRKFVNGEETLPIGCRIAAVDGLGVVEPGVATRDEVAVEVGDVASRVGEDGVVGGVRFQLQRFAERFVVFRLGADVRLRQGFDRFLHEPNAYPFAVVVANDGAVMAEVDGELLLGHAVGGLVWDCDLP